ncbi:hypothetical protein P8452_29063 [Trifolium repens]|nr:hypothetical protein P8452_29063 [Trifolium repens]
MRIFTKRKLLLLRPFKKLVIKPVINLISGDYGVGKSTLLLQALLKAICTCFQETHKPSICLIPDICKQMSMCQHYYSKALG